jgi:hypothetical protein
MTRTDYDSDPEALAWARAKVQREVARCRHYHRTATDAGDATQADMWRRLANRMDRVLVNGDGTDLAAFDARLADQTKGPAQ